MKVATSATLPAAVATGAGLPRVLAFGSSDSCEWCGLLERRVFASDAWRNWASGRIDFVRVDLPRGDGVLDPDARARNNGLADRLGVKGIPTVVLSRGCFFNPMKRIIASPRANARHSKCRGWNRGRRPLSSGPNR
jgi:hypothetical protein